MSTLSPKEEEKIRQDYATPAEIIVITNVCDKGVLEKIATMLKIDKVELASMCFQRGLYGLAEGCFDGTEDQP